MHFSVILCQYIQFIVFLHMIVGRPSDDYKSCNHVMTKLRYKDLLYMQCIFNCFVNHMCFICVLMHFSICNDPTLVFNPPEMIIDHYIAVEFHCLLMTSQWGFEDSSKVFIRFGAPQLGDFNYCYGPMQKNKGFVNCVCCT